MGNKNKKRERKDETAMEIYMRCRIHTLKGLHPHYLYLQLFLIMEEEWRVMSDADKASWIALEEGNIEARKAREKVRVILASLKEPQDEKY